MDEHYRLSQEVRDVLATARNEAARAAFTKAQTDHLLMALLIEQTCAKDILATTHVIASMVDGLLAHAPTTMKLKVQDVALGQSTLDLIRRADWHRTKWKHSELLAAHVLAAMLDRSDDDNATRIFRILCTNMDELRRKTEIHLKLLSCPESKPPKPHPEASSEPASTIPAPMHNVVQATPRKTGYKFEDWVTAETATLLANAKEHATKFQAQSVRVEDLAAALVMMPDDPACKILACYVDFHKVSNLTEVEYEGLKTSEEPDAFDYYALQVLGAANQQSRKLGQKLIRPTDILLGMLHLAELHEVLPNLFEVGDASKISEALLRLGSDSTSEDAHQQGSQLTPTSTTVNITARAFAALNKAKGEAKLLEHAEILNMHLVLGLIGVAQTSEIDFVKNRKFDLDIIRLQLAEDAGNRCRSLQAEKQPVFSKELKSVLELATAEAQRVNAQLLDINHIAIGILKKHSQEFEWLLSSHDMESRTLEKRLVNCWFHQVHKGGAVSEPGGAIDLEFIESHFEGEEIIPSTENDSSHPSYMNKLSGRTKRLLKCAESFADEFGHQRVCLEELILAMLVESSSAAALALDDVGVDLDSARESFKRTSTRGRGRKGSNKLALSPKALSTFKSAAKQATIFGNGFTDPEHLLLCITYEQKGISDLTLSTLGVDGQELGRALLERMESQ